MALALTLAAGSAGPLLLQDVGSPSVHAGGLATVTNNTTGPPPGAFEVAQDLGAAILVVVIIVIAVVAYEHSKRPRPWMPPQPPCPVCRRPLAWIPPYRRWYCPFCSQYR